MLKEIIICIVIVIAIVFGNNMSQNYTKESVRELSNQLNTLREDIIQKEVQNEKVQNEMNEIYKNWEKRHDKLAYVIEHDELEKVETQLIAIKSYIETEEYADSANELDKSVFILKHIEDKYAFNLENIF